MTVLRGLGELGGYKNKNREGARNAKTEIIPISMISKEFDRARRVKLLLLDVDGVLTRGDIVYDSQGNELKFFDVQDGTGISLAHTVGLKVGLISGRFSRIVESRAKDLGIMLLRQDSRDKLRDGTDMARHARLRLEQVAFMGDELIDIPLMTACGFGIAVANARPEVQAVAHYVTTHKGGEGAVREVIELILKAQNRWRKAIAPFLN